MRQLLAQLFVQSFTDKQLINMNKKTLYIFIIASFACITFNAQTLGEASLFALSENTYETGEQLIKIMYKTYKKAPCKAYTFSQLNLHYKDGVVSDSSVWHESIEFPDKFRIDFNNPKEGNYIIYKNDSIYQFKNNKLHSAKFENNTLLLLLGGMYYRDYDDVIERLKKENYNLEFIQEKIIKKDTFYIIGKTEVKKNQNDASLKELELKRLSKKKEFTEKESNQIWISKFNLQVVKIIETNEKGESIEMNFENHQKNCNGFIETKVTFKRNGEIEQTEEYYNIKQVKQFSGKVFKTN